MLEVIVLNSLATKSEKFIQYLDFSMNQNNTVWLKLRFFFQVKCVT